MGELSAGSCLRLVWTSAFAIAVSLLVSFTLTPMLAARLIKRSDDDRERGFEKVTEPADHGSKESRFYRPIDRGYTEIVDLARCIIVG